MLSFKQHLTERLWVHRIIQKRRQCTATAAKMILDYHNIPSDSAKEIHSQTGPENKGRSHKVIANFINSHYNAAATVKKGSIDMLRDSVKKNGPVVASVKRKADGGRHALVVLKVTKKHLHVVDPTEGFRGRFTDRNKIPIEDYNGSHMIIRPYTG